jgi:hypothetical protein
MLRVALFTTGFLLLSAAGLGAEEPHKNPSHAQGPAAAGPAKDDIQVPAPPFTEGIFPCTSCHDNKTQKVDRKRRQLAMHDEIVLKHGPESRWCLDCHDPLERDKLHLVSGDKIPFTVSYQLCGQCHGDKIRDWRVGIHGKRTGSWNGAKQYLLCVHCHNPHSPRFKHLKPMPPPVPPEKIQARKAGAP